MVLDIIYMHACLYIIFIFIAFKYEIALFSAPTINVYSPDFKSEEGVKINEICFDFPGAIENDSSLKDPVEFPRPPVAVKVPDFIMLIV